DTPVTPERFSQLLSMLERDEINANSAKEVLAQLFDSTETPEAVVEKGGLRQVSNTSEIEVIVDRIITENRSAVDDFHDGKTKAMGFLVGRAMQASQGKANPRLIKEMLSAKLGNNS
ncbi:MAG: Asp-tRNA(Asn)/Glu-tRNA(Gln) amidotransferase GatCAB subunit B, partial [Syntrophaceae bacterium]|nr:Asp-tRNA(Asn)/Glu-tRNA(Gln) amidotransferase GatCAB subunit B [Syntrophaceae bacterium]